MGVMDGPWGAGGSTPSECVEAHPLVCCAGSRMTAVAQGDGIQDGWDHSRACEASSEHVVFSGPLTGDAGPRFLKTSQMVVAQHERLVGYVQSEGWNAAATQEALKLWYSMGNWQWVQGILSARGMPMVKTKGQGVKVLTEAEAWPMHADYVRAWLKAHRAVKAQRRPAGPITPGECKWVSDDFEDTSSGGGGTRGPPEDAAEKARRDAVEQQREVEVAAAKKLVDDAAAAKKLIDDAAAAQKLIDDARAAQKVLDVAVAAQQLIVEAAVKIAAAKVLADHYGN